MHGILFIVIVSAIMTQIYVNYRLNKRINQKEDKK
jgi:hypothetical protein